MQSLLNGRNFKYNYCEGKFLILSQSYKISHVFCLNNFLQFWLIVNQGDHVPPFRYINWDDDVYHCVRGWKLLADMKYM